MLIFSKKNKFGLNFSLKEYFLFIKKIYLYTIQFPNYFHRNYQEFLEQQCRDQEKKELCEKNGIILIIFPQQIDINMNHPNIIQDYIISEFQRKTGIKLPLMPQYNHRNRGDNSMRKIDDYF